MEGKKKRKYAGTGMREGSKARAGHEILKSKDGQKKNNKKKYKGLK